MRAGGGRGGLWRRLAGKRPGILWSHPALGHARGGVRAVFQQGSSAVCGHFGVICHHHDERMGWCVPSSTSRAGGKGKVLGRWYFVCGLDCRVALRPPGPQRGQSTSVACAAVQLARATDGRHVRSFFDGFCKNQKKLVTSPRDVDDAPRGRAQPEHLPPPIPPAAASRARL